VANIGNHARFSSCRIFTRDNKRSATRRSTGNWACVQHSCCRDIHSTI